MRAVLIALAVVLCACGGGGPTLPVQVAPPSTPAIWPLRGTTAPDGDVIHIDEFQHADAFERVAGKVAPYNAYTSGEKIRAAAGEAGRARVDVPALQFDASVGKAAGKEAMSLVVPYTGAGKVSYAFDAASASYHRTQGGQATTDANAKKEVMPDNVGVI